MEKRQDDIYNTFAGPATEREIECAKGDKRIEVKSERKVKQGLKKRSEE